MNTLRTLHDAFSELEERADRASSLEYALPEPPSRHRLMPPLATAAAVLAVVAGVAAWQASRDGHPARPPAASGSTPASTTGAAHPNGFRPPGTVSELTAKARTILAGTATIIVDPKRSSACGAATAAAPSATADVAAGPSATMPAGSSGAPPLPKPAHQPVCSGAAIVGSLTSGGMTGGFDLDVFRAPRGQQPFCLEQARCTTDTLPDGSRLATSTWHDSEVPGGITYQTNVVRRDGAEIIFHLSTEHDPKGASVVTTPHMPLTVEQMTAFVTSDRW